MLRKHRAIRNSLGISVPVPVDTDQIIEAVFEGLLLRESAGNVKPYLPGCDELLRPQLEALNAQWDAASERERRSRTMFAQHAIRVEEVARELADVRSAIGSGDDIAEFMRDALRAHGAAVAGDEVLDADLRGTPRALREAVGGLDHLRGRFALPIREGEVYLSRTHPVVEGLATYVLDTALDPLADGVARRCGVMRTRRVQRRTTVLLVRFRYHIIVQRGGVERPLLVEDCRVLAFAGAPGNAEWLETTQAEELLRARPDGNVPPDQATNFLRTIVGGFDVLRPHLDEAARRRGAELLDAHRRVRTAAHARGGGERIEPQLPPDVLGLYVFLPMG